jgi:amino acid permease
MDPSAEPDGPVAKENGLSLLQVTVFLAGIMAGVGVLSLPKAMAEAGKRTTQR